MSWPLFYPGKKIISDWVSKIWPPFVFSVIWRFVVDYFHSTKFIIYQKFSSSYRTNNVFKGYGSKMGQVLVMNDKQVLSFETR